MSSIGWGGTGTVTGLASQGTYTGMNLNSGSEGSWSSGNTFAAGSQTSQPSGYAYSWTSPNMGSYGLPSGTAARGAFGEGGPYTELDYPEMRFLRAGENPTELLSGLRQQQGKPSSLAQALVIGLVALALLK